MEERNEQQALLESVRAALEGCDEQEREALGHELAALAEGFAGAAEWEAEQLARSEARAQMEQRLAGRPFARISSSELVNVRMVTGMDFSLAGTIRISLKGGVTTYVSRRHVAEIKKLFDL